MKNRVIGIIAGAAIGWYLSSRRLGGAGAAVSAYAPYFAALLGAVIGFVIAWGGPPLIAMARPVRWSGGVARISSRTDLDALLAKAGTHPVLIDMYATWCPPCRAMTPNVDALAAEGHFVGVVDVDAARDLARQFEIKSIPTALVFKNTSLVRRASGYHTLDSLRKLVQ